MERTSLRCIKIILFLWFFSEELIEKFRFQYGIFVGRAWVSRRPSYKKIGHSRGNNIDVRRFFLYWKMKFSESVIILQRIFWIGIIIVDGTAEKPRVGNILVLDKKKLCTWTNFGNLFKVVWWAHFLFAEWSAFESILCQSSVSKLQ